MVSQHDSENVSYVLAISTQYTIPACDRQTDGHLATAQSTLHIASHGKNHKIYPSVFNAPTKDAPSEFRKGVYY